jgi:hypothetical protein
MLPVQQHAPSLGRKCSLQQLQQAGTRPVLGSQACIRAPTHPANIHPLPPNHHHCCCCGPRRETVIPLTMLDPSSKGMVKGRPAPTPWRRMMTSLPVWAIVVNNFSFHYAFYVVMNWLPTYFNSVLKVGSLQGLAVLAVLLGPHICAAHTAPHSPLPPPCSPPPPSLLQPNCPRPPYRPTLAEIL